jgi:EPS-associated MarR family transcriptional regulator
MTPEQQAHFRLLKTLEEHPEYSQRELAEAIGLSVGRTNFVIHALMEKGLIKIGRFLQSNKKLTKTAYILTPDGLHHRMDLTRSYIERKKMEYETLKAELEALEKEQSIIGIGSEGHHLK